MAEISVWISSFLSILSMRARSTLRILPRMGRIAWVARVAGLDGGAAGRVALDDEQLALVAVLGRAVLELVGHAGAVEQRLAAGRRRGPCGPRPGPGRPRCPCWTILLASVGFSSSQSPSFSLVALCDQRLHGGVAELGLGLALELRVAQPHRDDGGEALADVLAGEVGVLLLEEVLGPGVLVDRVGERRLEALLVRAALDGGDAVGEGVDAVGVVSRCSTGTRPRPRVASSSAQVADLGEQRLLRLVDVLDEVDDAAGVLVDDRLGGRGPGARP